MTGMKSKDELYALAERDFEAGAGAVIINREVLRTLKPSEKPFSLMGAGLKGRAVGEKLEHAVAYILVLNALNWMFWDRSADGKKTFTRYAFEGEVGAVGMRKAFTRGWGDDTSPATLIAALEEEGVTGIFGDIPAPLLREQCLIDVLGSNLDKAVYAICEAAVNRQQLTFKEAVLVQELFPVSYRDVYLKRAQLALAEVAGHLAESGTSVELDVTAFADYQVPRVLRGIGVIEYSDSLAARIERQELIAEGSREERAIRGATIIACKEMAQWLGTSDAAIDNYLWTKRNAVGNTPFHLTVTTDY
jgi:hypothetical protein